MTVAIDIPDLCLLLLVGPSCSGKSTFARRHFKASEVVSSDACRAMVADDENDQSVSADAFQLVRAIADRRLCHRRFTAIDATNVDPAARAELVTLARHHHVETFAIVFELPEHVLMERLARRTDRDMDPEIVRAQRTALVRSLPGLAGEGIQVAAHLRDAQETTDAVVARQPLQSDLRRLRGPFDIVGDVHGCLAELTTLLGRLGYVIDPASGAAAHAGGRTLVLLGDLGDRGPDTPGVIRLVRATIAAGHGHCVVGNHDDKLARALEGRHVTVSHGLDRSLDQYRQVSGAERLDVARFLLALPSHLVLDGGALVAAHAGMRADLQGRTSARVRSFALYGETTGEVDEFGLPVRLDWARRYHGAAMVAYGHTPVREPRWVNNTICLDTGCVFGGQLTALRYPERELVQVPAQRAWYERAQPL